MSVTPEYSKYLASQHWQTLRKRALHRDGRKCVRCGTDKRLQVHHRTYRQRYEDTVLDDLVTVCKACHRKEHCRGEVCMEGAMLWQEGMGLPVLIKSKRRIFGRREVLITPKHGEGEQWISEESVKQRKQTKEQI